MPAPLPLSESPTPSAVLHFAREAFPKAFGDDFAPMHLEMVGWATGMWGPPADVAVLAIPRGHGATMLLSLALPLCIAVAHPEANVALIFPNDAHSRAMHQDLRDAARIDPDWASALHRIKFLTMREAIKYGRLRGMRLDYVGIDAPEIVPPSAPVYLRLTQPWDELAIIGRAVRPGGRVVVYGAYERHDGIMAHLLAPGPLDPTARPRLARHVWDAELSDGSPAWPERFTERHLARIRRSMSQDDYDLSWRNLPDRAVLREYERDRAETARLEGVLREAREQFTFITGEPIEYAGGWRR